MKTEEILIRLLLSLLFSGIIGLEREKKQSNAGIKTHSLVGVSACLIAVIQSEIGKDALAMALKYPEFTSLFGSDPARLTAQVISGIGFLGAGTIIVTKRSISGLTTAASIWSVACLGIAVGMGYFKISMIAFFIMFSILFVLKRVIHISAPTMVIIKYLDGLKTLESIKKDLKKLDLEYSVIKYDVQVYGEVKLFTSVFEIKSIDRQYFDKLIDLLTHNESVINCEQTKIET